MTNTSLDISNKISRTTGDCLSALQAEACTLELDILLVGATARDILFSEYSITGRATEDVDIGIVVGNWNLYYTYIQQLIDRGSFTLDTKRKHRLYFEQTLPVDIIPFGGIEEPEGNIIWPEDEGCTMRVTGFKDVHRHAIPTRIGQEKQIGLASLPGMAILKIIAWDERHKEFPTKDAEDLSLILNNYAHAGNTDRLYTVYFEIIRELDGDLELAGARLLGKDMASIMSPTTRDTVREILERNIIPEKSDKLVEAVYQHLPGNNYERTLYLLQNMKEGVEVP